MYLTDHFAVRIANEATTSLKFTDEPSRPV
jgi:hypothetical protein